MKQGAPIRDVNMDTGISVAMTDLAAVSIMSINRAPDAILAGTTDRLSFPNIMRTMWGMRSPIQPICPHMETTAAVTMAAPESPGCGFSLPECPETLPRPQEATWY